MRPSLTSGLAAIACLLLAAAASAQDAPPAPAQPPPIDLDAESSEFDRRSNRLVFRKLRITQGELGIAADAAEATRLDFENSRWTFRGNVVIDNAGARALCDDAELTFSGHQLRSALLRGAPARFAQQRADERRTEGRAASMEYEVASGLIRLSGDAWLSDGANEVSGERISYDLGREYVIADAGESGLVRMKINPPARNGTSEDAP